jgi:MoaA/NifB/PqqE/SkfB family radical SAM enzyme
MCSRWQKDPDVEISLEKIREVFANPLFSKVEDVSLHGGEPTLRKDLAQICQTVQKYCPELNRLWISTNGFGAKRIEKRIHEILSIIDFTKLLTLDINISIDGLEETHDRIRGVRGGFNQCVETIRVLNNLAKDYPISLSIGTVIQPLNIHQVGELESFAENLGLPINFQPLMFDKFFNISDDTCLTFSKQDMARFIEIIETKLTKGHTTTTFYWRDLLSMIGGAKRKSPCAFDRYVFSLYPTGEVLPCSREDWIVFGNVFEQSPDNIWFSNKAKEIRRKMRKEVCPTCSFYCGVEFALQKEFFTYLLFYLRNRIFNFSKNNNRSS